MDAHITIFIFFLSICTFAVCENMNFIADIGEETEISDVVKKYMSRIVSDLTVKYDNRIQELQTTISAQADDRIKELQRTVNAQGKRIKKLEMDKRFDAYAMSLLQKRIGDLEAKCDKRKTGRDAKAIRHNQPIENKTHIQMEPCIKNTRQKQKKLKRESESRIRRTNAETRVAFFAYMTSHSTHLGTHQDIVFDHTVTNIGNAYNERHGIFTAPAAGTYVLSVTLTHIKSGSLSDKLWGEFVVNGKIVARFYMAEEQSSQTIIMNLKAGDDVSVQNKHLDQGVYGDGYSTFSGFLLYDNVSDISVVG